MRRTYRVRAEGETPDAAREFPAETMADAAERFCWLRDAQDLEYPPERTVFVTDRWGIEHAFVVTQRPVPQYLALRKK